jgi:hypothetical protein
MPHAMRKSLERVLDVQRVHGRLRGDAQPQRLQPDHRLARGRGNVALGSATLTTGNDNTSTLFSGVISGTGGLTKIGAAR